MQTVAAPASIRAQAAAICRLHGLGVLSTQRTLNEAGDTMFTDAMIALEAAFEIDLDVDEVWAGATLADLLLLVEVKVADLSRLALLPANDDFIDRQRSRRLSPRAPSAHAVRARRLYGRRLRRQGLRRSAFLIGLAIALLPVAVWATQLVAAQLARPL